MSRGAPPVDLESSRVKCAAMTSKAHMTPRSSVPGARMYSSAPTTSSIRFSSTQKRRVYGRVTAAVIAAGRKPRRRALDLMIASIAIAKELPLYTTNPDDFVGLEQLMTVVPCGGR